MVGLISTIIFIALLLFILGIYYTAEYRQGQLKVLKRLKQQMGEEIPLEEKTNFLPIVKNRILRFLGSLGERIKPKKEKDLSHLRKTLIKGGYRKENAPIIFFGIKALLAILLPVIFFFIRLSFMITMTYFNSLIFFFGLALVGFYLPNLWLQMKISSRRNQIEKGFPDALDLMVVCLEAGTGLDAAINRVGEEMKLSNKLLSEEFKLLSLELRAGKARNEALKNLALRTDLEDVNSLVTLLVQTEKFGTSISQALRVYSDSMRTKRYQRAEELAAKLPVKLVFPLIVFIFPCLFVVVVGPAAIKILRLLLPVLGGR